MLMAGTAHKNQKTKHSYFHSNNSTLNTNQPSSVCSSSYQEQSMMSSSTSPWYHPSAISGDNDDSAFCDGTTLSIDPLTTMNKPPSSSSLNTDCTYPNQQPYENYGHFFVKKTFHKPTYCHHCVEMLWGLIGQGYYCEGIIISILCQNFISCYFKYAILFAMTVVENMSYRHAQALHLYL